MRNFSPYIYEINALPLIKINQIDSLYDNFTFLSKPEKRNTYKISLGQIIHYLIDFGIGYNSVCITTLPVENEQKFSSTMYVNRHNSTSEQRPATVADLKEKLKGAVEILIKAVIQDNRLGVNVVDTIYPKYIFTLDEKLNSFKLKQLTGKEYIEVEDFSDFPFTDTVASISKITNENGYIPADSLLMCPQHNHGGNVNDTMKKSINYSWGSYLKPKGDTVWVGHGNNVYEHNHGATADARQRDSISPIWNGSIDKGSVDAPSFSPSWEFPTGVTCHENKKVLPKNTIDGENVTIRFPGRRYRLFKQVGI